MKFQLFHPLLLLIFHFSILPLVSSQYYCHDHQKSALLHFFSTNSTSSLPSWRPHTDCCEWEGITCDAATGHVVALDITGRSVSGSINSSAFASLGSLLSLDLSRNNFISSIPSNLSLLSNLTHLNLSNSGFTGQIPADIAQLNKLKALDLSTSPTDIRLRSLKLENPSVGLLLRNLSRLTQLHLDGVDISSPLPKFLSNFTHLTSVNLSSCNLAGEFPTHIFLLPKLGTLDASLNLQLMGSLPAFSGESALRALQLSYTRFSGSLPHSFGNLSNLSRVDLSYGDFSGPIPSLDGLTELKYLDLSFNNFSGQIPSLANLTRLAVLELSYNLFSGSIPLVDSLKAIRKIDLSSNNLTGEIPQSSGNGLHNVTVLDLGNNRLQGTIPSYLFSLPSLRVLYLDENQLHGQLTELGDCSSPLELLELSFNRFNGSLDLVMLQNMTNLFWLGLSDNSLLVDANVDTSSFPQLEMLYLGSCNLKQFPHFLRNQSWLIDLELSNNSIVGEIPNWIWNLGSGSLSYLNLSQNLLSGLQQPHNLSSSGLWILDLHSNQLRGEIPNLPISVGVVNYSKNKFTSTVSSEFAATLSGAVFFSLSSNNVSGEIPSTLCKASDLQVLDLSDNHLGGSIPNCVSDLNLEVLNLRNNHLTGIIPNTSSKKNCSLRTLILNGNQLEGKIPESLSYCGELEVLDVGNNRLGGTFPYYLKTLSNLRVLVLRSNNFSSSFSQHCNFSFPVLQIIDLSSNNFWGRLPNCFQGLNSMMFTGGDEDAGVTQEFIEYSFLSRFYYQDSVMVRSKGLQLKLLKIFTFFKSVDLSNNKFEGEIPKEIGALNLLRVLNISNNHLTGQIPASIGNLRQLESLDLSENQLSGRIPPQLGQLTFLEVLNLSHNQLVGSIPTGRQLQTFGNDSFVGNPQLCGMPLSRNCSPESANALPPTTSTEAEESSEGGFDWELIFGGLGFGGGMGIIVGPLLLGRNGRRWHERLVDKVVVMIFPPRICDYLHCKHPRVEAEEQVDEDFSETETNSEKEKAEEGRHCFCVFCARIDAKWEKVMHKDCSCHEFLPAELNV